MMKLELVVAGLALIWGPLSDGTAKIYFPKAEKVTEICTEPMDELHQLRIVFQTADFDSSSRNVDYTTFRVGPVEYAVVDFCHDFTLVAPGIETPTVKYNKGGRRVRSKRHRELLEREFRLCCQGH